MEKKGDVLNQLAIISDLLEKINLNIKSTTVIIETDEENFNIAFENTQKKYGRKIDKPELTFTITIGEVDIVFNKSNV
jgi:aspartyl-tRNA synthetase